eukprot:6491801-Amphidinium_carterae.1
MSHTLRQYYHPHIQRDTTGYAAMSTQLCKCRACTLYILQSGLGQRVLDLAVGRFTLLDLVRRGSTFACGATTSKGMTSQNQLAVLLTGRSMDPHIHIRAVDIAQPVCRRVAPMEALHDVTHECAHR